MGKFAQVVIEPLTPAIEPSPSAGNNWSEFQISFCQVPIGGLVQLAAHSKTSQLIPASVPCGAEVVSLVFRHCFRMFAQPLRQFEAQLVLDGVCFSHRNNFVDFAVP